MICFSIIYWLWRFVLNRLCWLSAVRLTLIAISNGLIRIYIWVFICFWLYGIFVICCLLFRYCCSCICVGNFLTVLSVWNCFIYWLSIFWCVFRWNNLWFLWLYLALIFFSNWWFSQCFLIIFVRSMHCGLEIFYLFLKLFDLFFYLSFFLILNTFFLWYLIHIILFFYWFFALHRTLLF